MPNRKTIMIFFISIFPLLLVSLYVYGQVRGVSHHPLEIECKNELCVKGTGVGIGTTSPSYKLHVVGDVYVNGWLRTSGDRGWYNQSYGGGWYMTDSTWIRSYNGKPVYSSSEIRSGSGLGVVKNSGDSAILRLYSGGADRIILDTGRYGNEANMLVPNNDLRLFIGGGRGLIIRDNSGNDNANLQVHTVYSSEIYSTGVIKSTTRAQNFSRIPVRELTEKQPNCKEDDIYRQRNLLFCISGCNRWCGDKNYSGGTLVEYNRESHTVECVCIP